ncbi:hypothetical protein EJB05_10441, partial [Eragrostis curvula]
LAGSARGSPATSRARRPSGARRARRRPTPPSSSTRCASSAPAPARGREVRDAADRALAAAARGRSRWSRAILARRRRRTALQRARLPRAAGCSGASSGSPPPQQQQPAVARKAKVLGRLVPGCRKLAFPALLAEVSDYIAALEMQVRTMNAVAQALASVSGSSPS